MKTPLPACFAATFILLISPVGSAQQTRPTDPFQDLPQLVDELMSRWRIPGMAIGVVRDGQVVYKQGFGYRDLDRRLPVTTNTVFGVGSITKTFTSLSVALLVDDAKLGWDTPIIQALPDFKLYDDDATSHATPRDLLCHRTGMAEHLLMTYGSPFSREEVYRRLRFLEPNVGFRERYQYNNLMYLTAGYLVGRLSGGTWEDFVMKRILQPLGMNATNFAGDIAKTSDFSLPYILRRGEIVALPFRNRATSAPAGGINSSLDDMLAWLAFHLSSGKVGGKQLVAARTLREIFTPQIPVSFAPGSPTGAVTDYGLGWNIQPYQGFHLNHAGGWIEGFVSWISFMPEERTGVAVLCNMSDSSLPFFLNYVLYDRVLGVRKIDWKRILDNYQPEYLKPSYGVQRAPPSDPARPPRPPARELAGTYHHQAYGEIVIASENGTLSASLNGEKMVLNHWSDNTFVTGHALAGFHGRTAKFVANGQGKVDRLEMMLQPGVKDIVFMRR